MTSIFIFNNWFHIELQKLENILLASEVNFVINENCANYIEIIKRFDKKYSLRFYSNNSDLFGTLILKHNELFSLYKLLKNINENELDMTLDNNYKWYHLKISAKNTKGVNVRTSPEIASTNVAGILPHANNLITEGVIDTNKKTESNGYTWFPIKMFNNTTFDPDKIYWVAESVVNIEVGEAVIVDLPDDTDYLFYDFDIGGKPTTFRATEEGKAMLVDILRSVADHIEALEGKK